MQRPPCAPPALLPGLLLLWAAGHVSPGHSQEVQAENVTVLEGGTAEITCHLHRYDGSIVVIQNPARQTLFFNGTRALKDERFELAEFSRRRLRLRLARARLEDEGGYFCQLYADDTHHQIATLTVLGMAHLGTHLGTPGRGRTKKTRNTPGHTWGTPGDPGYLGEPGDIWVTWVPGQSGAHLGTPGDTWGAHLCPPAPAGRSSHRQEGKVFWQRSVLQLRPERRDHGAIVTCEATHPALGRGQRRQTQYQLDVQYPPSVRIHPSQSVLREGDTLVLTCAINGNPRPTEVWWSRMNESLPPRARAEGERLTLPALAPQDNGTYTCQVGNAHGRAHDTYVLVVYDPGAVVAAQGAGPFAVVGGALALLVFLLLLLLGALVWCSVRQKGSYLTHEASALEDQGEAREAFLGGEGGKRKEEFFI
ncbi:cell adhesion molecule 4 [Zonotrichia leucophrys gambelii]|uniref:cell adhesion molecule 4 n=1 Tax=Zonotrichia leucophrys gambelii TaxID=257770 RepID=UPI003140BA65